MLAVSAPIADVTWTGEDNIVRFQSSDWAERAHCGRCGSSLFYRVTMDHPMQDELAIALGTLDDTSGLTLSEEIYIDHKPEGFAFTGDHPRLTRAETLKKFGISEEDN